MKARKKNTQGRVLIDFVVEENGMIHDIQIIQDIGPGSGDAVISVIEQMNE